MKNGGGSNFVKAVVDLIEKHAYQAKLDLYDGMDLGPRCHGCNMPEKGIKRDILRCNNNGCLSIVTCGNSFCVRPEKTCSVCNSYACLSCLKTCAIPDCQEFICRSCLLIQRKCILLECPNNRDVCRTHKKLVRSVRIGSRLFLCCDDCEACLDSCPQCVREAGAAVCEDCGKFHCPHKNKAGCAQKRQKI